MEAVTEKYSSIENDYALSECKECGRELTKEDFESGNVFYCDNCGSYFCSDCVITVKHGEYFSDFYCPICSPKVRKVLTPKL
ncbi:MAG: hypothetical protein QW478_05215 [Candidatus Micrarchaeaceae archaeon]